MKYAILLHPLPIWYPFRSPTQRITAVQQESFDDQFSNITKLQFGTVYIFLETAPQQNIVKNGVVFRGTITTRFMFDEMVLNEDSQSFLHLEIVNSKLVTVLSLTFSHKIMGIELDGPKNIEYECVKIKLLSASAPSTEKAYIKG